MRQITYCSNIHPAESWKGIRQSLDSHIPELKARFSRDEPFPLGIWLSHRALGECELEGPERFLDWCEARGCFVLTLNGFPYGPFHGAPVKERVYLPDWRSPLRVDHSRRLATILDQWLPAGLQGSISTLPVGWKPWIHPEDLPLVRRHLVLVLEHLDGLRQRSGKEILLALEPEPGCFLETSSEAISFFQELDLPDHLRPLLGLCYDACHQAVLFEDPRGSLRALRDARIPIAKVQASCALRFPGGDPSCMEAFCEGTYLHQTVIRTEEGLMAFPDLPQALAGHRGRGHEWRVHLHVPLFLERVSEGCLTTRSFLEEILGLLEPEVPIEVETYTWHLLPPGLRGSSLTECLLRELCWVRERSRPPKA